MIGTSWTHLLARVLVRPLVGTWVRPNHLTTLRLLSGAAACALFAQGTRAGMEWGGAIWLVSAFRDRADGELARIGDMMSRGGHVYDDYADTVINAGFCVAIGIGLRQSWLGRWSLRFGVLTGVSMFLCSVFAEWLELRSPPGTRAHAGKWGFDPDDALYLMGPLVWLGWLAPILIGASVGATAMMIITGVRLQRLRTESRPVAARASFTIDMSPTAGVGYQRRRSCAPFLRRRIVASRSSVVTAGVAAGRCPRTSVTLTFVTVGATSLVLFVHRP